MTPNTDTKPILINLDGELVNAHEMRAEGIKHEWNEDGTVKVTLLETGDTFDLTADEHGVIVQVS